MLNKTITLIAAVIMVACAGVLPAESLKTGDGLEIELSRKGYISSVRTGTTALPLANVISGFSVVDQAELGENAMLNGGLEAGLKGWDIPPGAKHWGVDEQVARTGKKSLRLALPGRIKRSTLEVFSPVAQVKPDTSSSLPGRMKPRSTGISY